MTSCFLTPGSDSEWIAPASRRAEVEARFGEYLVDVADFRAADKSRLLNQCRALTDQHFGIFRHLIRTTECELAMIVDLAPDRLHHGLLASILPEHPLHDPDGPHVEACRSYYRALDEQIARTLALAGPRTTTIVVSDHGVQPLHGGFCVNQWLVDKGYLVIDPLPSIATPLNRCAVDWSRTRAWGEGGHHGRIFLNRVGRDPQGIVPAERFEAERRQLIDRIKAMRRDGGRPMINDVFIPEQTYCAVNGHPPDLIVYWDELRLRSLGTLGHGGRFPQRNDTGEDEANHAPDGIFVVTGKGQTPARRHFGLADVFHAMLDGLGLEPPEETA